MHLIEATKSCATAFVAENRQSQDIALEACMPVAVWPSNPFASDTQY